MTNQITKNTKSEIEGLDTHVRFFPKVMKDKKLTLLQKHIICDVISYQIQQKKYFKTSARLAEELGNYKAGTIQTNFQFLNDNGYLDCFPYSQNNEYDYDLREARVVQMEKWIYTDQHLQEIKFEIKPLEKKGPDHPMKLLWKNRKGSSEVKVEKIDEIIPNSIVSEEFDLAKFLTPVRLKVLNNIATQEVLDIDVLHKELKLRSKEDIYCLFGYQDGVWYYQNEKNNKHWENAQGIHYTCNYGNRCTLSVYYEDGKLKERFEINENKLYEYFEKNNKQFKDLNMDNFATLSQFKAKPLNMYGFG